MADLFWWPTGSFVKAIGVSVHKYHKHLDQGCPGPKTAARGPTCPCDSSRITNAEISAIYITILLTIANIIDQHSYRPIYVHVGLLYEVDYPLIIYNTIYIIIYNHTVAG